LTTTVKDPVGNSVDNTHPAAVGTVVHDTAALSGQVGAVSFDGSATVTYDFFNTNNCSGSPTVQTVTVATDGSIPASLPQTLAPGAYSYQATYNGNSSYNAVTSACEPFVLVQPITDGELCTFDVDSGTAG